MWYLHAVHNIWSMWTTWSQPTATGSCPATRTRMRNCEVDPSIAGMNASQPACDGSCTVNTRDQLTQPVNTQRCGTDINGTLATTTGMFNVLQLLTLKTGSVA